VLRWDDGESNVLTQEFAAEECESTASVNGSARHAVLAGDV
jgi:hypothetical protein